MIEIIKEISSKEHIDFLKRNKATKEQVSLNPKGKFYGYYIKDKIAGTISINETKNNIRVKGFYVLKSFRKTGIGTELLKHVLHNNKEFSAYATERSYKIFKQERFETVSFNKNNNVRFMRRDTIWENL